jgi:hypothetical protein
MGVLGALAGLGLVLLVLLDGFEAMVLPRRVTRSLRPIRLYYRFTWAVWRRVANRIQWPRRRETFLSVFGPLSMLVLFALWVTGLIFGFALIGWSLGLPLHLPVGTPSGFGTYLYVSGVTFFTLGYGEVTPASALGRVLAVVESGVGFGFLAVIIGYLPVLYAAFSRREATISLLDARAGSPPSVAQLLVRLGRARQVGAIQPLLAEWERWAADLLEDSLSFPMLGYYRSQHDNQSWLSALTMILDTCSVVLAGLKGTDRYQAQLTFAMSRHAAVDIALVFHTSPILPDPGRLPPEQCQRLRAQLRAAGLELAEGEAVEARLAQLRGTYEPFVEALAAHFCMKLPLFIPEKEAIDNWQTTAWARRAPGFEKLALEGDEHFV